LRDAAADRLDALDAEKWELSTQVRELTGRLEVARSTYPASDSALAACQRELADATANRAAWIEQLDIRQAQIQQAIRQSEDAILQRDAIKLRAEAAEAERDRLREALDDAMDRARERGERT
jgi:chromosome segregation ATPase